MSAPSPVIVETLASHVPINSLRGEPSAWFICCKCNVSGAKFSSREEHRVHVAQALADAGVLGPEQVRERERSTRGLLIAADSVLSLIRYRGPRLSEQDNADADEVIARLRAATRTAR